MEMNGPATPGNRRLVDVAAAVIERDGKLMICQRRPEDSGGGFWEFPGGKREPGETLEQCLVREIGEELGCTITAGPLIAMIPAVWKDRDLRLHFFAATITAGVPEPIEVARIEWIDRARLGEFEFLPSNGPLLAQLMSPAG